jgi:hypothetical protein
LLDRLAFFCSTILHFWFTSARPPCIFLNFCSAILHVFARHLIFLLGHLALKQNEAIKTSDRRIAEKAAKKVVADGEEPGAYSEERRLENLR